MWYISLIKVLHIVCLPRETILHRNTGTVWGAVVLGSLPGSAVVLMRSLGQVMSALKGLISLVL